MKRYISVAVFVGIVIGANALTNALGLVTWLGVVATAGTWLAGFAFVARDYVQDTGGRRWVLIAIGLGALVTAIFSPRLALASCTAFVVSELADYLVYTPLRKRNRTGAALISNVVGAIVDSAIFLAISGFPMSTLPGQVLIKVGVTSLFVLLMWGSRAVLRKSVQPSSDPGHA